MASKIESCSQSELISQSEGVILNSFQDLVKPPETLKQVQGDGVCVQHDDRYVHDNIINFLKFLHSKKEFEAYYLLLNNVEIKSFENNILEILCGNDISKKVVDQIGKLLFTMTGEKYNIIISKQSSIVSLKTRLISQVTAGSEWKLINDNFPDALILDLLLE